MTPITTTLNAQAGSKLLYKMFIHNVSIHKYIYIY
jgi:hypothetical protein